MRRYVSSVREVVGAEGPLVVSNEIFVPGYDKRAIPGSPLRDSTQGQLAEVGFDAVGPAAPRRLVELSLSAGVAPAPRNPQPPLGRGR